MASPTGADDNIVDDGPRDWSDLTTRLNSFRTFPQAEQVPPERLARAGFYYTHESDRVRCFSCLHTVENWHHGENPVDRHRKVCPECTFLNCVHRENPPARTSSYNPVSIYNEDAEAMEFRLRTGEEVDETMYPKIPHMKHEDARFKTFSNWPSSSPVRPADLAQAGLFYVQEGVRGIDTVQCFCCGGMLSGWEEGDDPWDEHNRHYQNCFFILGHDVGNIPSEQPRQSAHNGLLESFEGRLQSFRDRDHTINPERLARAGFYSTGELDRVLCFKCGGGLKDWQPNEDPWEEHAKHYPGCSFLLAEKGQEFINSVQLRSPGRSSLNGFSSHEKSSNAMQSEFAQKAVAMGFDPIKVERTILEKIRQSNQGYSTLEALIEDLTKARFDSDSDVHQETLSEDPMKKLEKLQHEKLCKVCMDSDTSIVFVPCGHLVTCKKCSDSLSKCPICCADITQKIKIYCS